MALLQENKRVKVKTSCSGQSVSFPFKAALQRLLKDVVLVVVVSELFKPHAVSLDMLEQQGAEKFDTQIACPCNSQKSIAGPSGPLSHCCMSWWICIDSRGQQSQAQPKQMSDVANVRKHVKVVQLRDYCETEYFQ